MKIEKFNENTLLPNPFEKLNELENRLVAIKKELSDTQQKIFPILLKYLLIRPELKDDQDIKISKYSGSVESFTFIDRSKPYYSKYAPKDAIYSIEYLPNEETEEEDVEVAWLTKSDVDDFLVFMSDQKMYKDAKRYNL
jgi:hypothetical protein